MTSPLHFSIKYDGPALVEHEMDVRELAPALMALGDMIKAANTTLYGDRSEVQVNVKGSFKGGSFGVDLAAVQTVFAQISTLLAGENSAAAANLFGILSGIGLLGGGGLIGLLIKLRGRRPSRIENVDNGMVITVLEEETWERISVDLQTGRLLQDRGVRKSLQQVMRPLLQDGIESFAAGRRGQAEVLVTREEADWFSYDDGAVELNSNVIEQVCLIESLTFKEDNKWKLNDGHTFYAVMEDAKFLDAIDRGTERFGKGDRIRVLMRIVQHERNGKIETSHYVVQVLEHHTHQQSNLF
jgi:hypothetical protein